MTHTTHQQNAANVCRVTGVRVASEATYQCPCLMGQSTCLPRAKDNCRACSCIWAFRLSSLEQQHPSCSVSLYTWSCEKCSLSRTGAPSPFGLDKPSNLPLHHFLLLQLRLIDSIHSAARLENITCWGNQICNPKFFCCPQTNHLFLSPSTSHLGYTMNAPRSAHGDIPMRLG